MRRTGNHRLRPARSDANRARPEIDRLTREIAAAKARGDMAAAERMETEKAWAVANSLCR